MRSEDSTDKEHATIHADAKTDQHSSETKQPVAPAVAKPDPKPSPHKYDISCDKKRDWIDKLTIGLEGFGLFVLIVYTIFTGLMYFSNKKAADAAKSAADTAKTQLESNVRPWVGITGSGIGEIKLTLIEKQPLAVTIHGQNVGNAPALNEIAVNKMTLAPAPIVPSFGDYSMSDAGPPVVLFPGAIYTVQIGTGKPSDKGNAFPALSSGDIKAIRTGKVRVWVYGSIWYDDTLHSRGHRTDYCFLYDFEGSSDTVTSFAACKTHNYAD
jgi:hypothetical protein